MTTIDGNNNIPIEKNDEVTTDSSDIIGIQTLAPSHILQDGRFINLPEPTNRERVRFFERSIAKHNLLEAYLQGKKSTGDDKKDDEDDDEKGSKTKKGKEPQIHPLALASAKLQSDGINELNRAINLQSLASTGEYFTLSNIVDPSLEIMAATASAPPPPSATAATPSSSSTDGANKSADGSGEKKGDATATTKVPPSAAVAAAAVEKLESERELIKEQRLKAMFILKRKRMQFENAGKQVFRRHRRRLTAAIVAQSLPDQRLRELRPFWRLVAPEHGTRALPHATRPTEVVAADVDVYRNDVITTTSDGTSASTTGGASRLAVRVPRYATMELQNGYTVDNDVKKWKKRYIQNSNELNLGKSDEDKKDDDDAMDVDANRSMTDVVMSEKLRNEGTDAVESTTKNDKAASSTVLDKVWTRAEPFAIADPSLGKMGADFDPANVPMLTLQFDIEKQSTGFVQRACLEPIAESSSGDDAAKNPNNKDDERLLVALQHSLFCAKLFESIRREVAPDTEEIGQIRTAARQSVVWINAETEENFLPPPSLMSGSDWAGGTAALLVVHIHEGDAKVLLDSEYALRIRLVEASNANTSSVTIDRTTNPNADSTENDRHSSGSQSPEQLLALCKTLLLHAQETYHRHSIETEAKLRLQEEKDNADLANLTPFQIQQRQQAKINQHKMKGKKSDDADSARILGSCVALGSKILFERRIRATLRNVEDWIQSLPDHQIDSNLVVEWLPLSIFDFSAHFTVAYKHWVIDATIVRDEITITQFNPLHGTAASHYHENGGTSTTTSGGTCYRKVKFNCAQQFELFLKMALRKVIQ